MNAGPGTQERETKDGADRTPRGGRVCSQLSYSVVAQCMLRYSLLLLPPDCSSWTNSCAAPLSLELLPHPGLKPVLKLSKRSVFTEVNGGAAD